MDSATAGSSLPKSLLADRLTEARIAWHLRCALRLGLDGSANARRAVAFVANLRAPRNGEVTLFTGVERMGTPSQALVPAGVRGGRVQPLPDDGAGRALSASVHAPSGRADVITPRAVADPVRDPLGARDVAS